MWATTTPGWLLVSPATTVVSPAPTPRPAPVATPPISEPWAATSSAPASWGTTTSPILWLAGPATSPAPPAPPATPTTVCPAPPPRAGRSPAAAPASAVWGSTNYRRLSAVAPPVSTHAWVAAVQLPRAVPATPVCTAVCRAVPACAWISTTTTGAISYASVATTCVWPAATHRCVWPATLQPETPRIWPPAPASPVSTTTGSVRPVWAVWAPALLAPILIIALLVLLWDTWVLHRAVCACPGPTSRTVWPATTVVWAAWGCRPVARPATALRLDCSTAVLRLVCVIQVTTTTGQTNYVCSVTTPAPLAPTPLPVWPVPATVSSTLRPGTAIAYRPSTRTASTSTVYPATTPAPPVLHFLPAPVATQPWPGLPPPPHRCVSVRWGTMIPVATRYVLPAISSAIPVPRLVLVLRVWPAISEPWAVRAVPAMLATTTTRWPCAPCASTVAWPARQVLLVWPATSPKTGPTPPAPTAPARLVSTTCRAPCSAPPATTPVWPARPRPPTVWPAPPLAPSAAQPSPAPVPPAITTQVLPRVCPAITVVWPAPRAPNVWVAGRPDSWPLLFSAPASAVTIRWQTKACVRPVLLPAPNAPISRSALSATLPPISGSCWTPPASVPPVTTTLLPQIIYVSCASTPARVATRAVSAPPAISITREPTMLLLCCVRARRGITMTGRISRVWPVPTIAWRARGRRRVWLVRLHGRLTVRVAGVYA